jgi:DNA-binding MarR family transcriptional regulator
MPRRTRRSSERPAGDGAPPDEMKASGAKLDGRFAYEGLERTIHEKARLGILASLASNPRGLLFADLKQLCALTDGNLSRHLQTLQEAGLVEVWKRFQDKRPQTLCRLTAHGRERLVAYVEQLGKVVADAVAAEHAAGREGARSQPLPGWSPA